MTDHPHVPPSDCPVCGHRLNITQLGCQSCGTGLTGVFTSCSYCSLGEQDRRMLRTFLASRGNMRELARELGVSYPTARLRFAELLERLGIESVEGDATTDDRTEGWEDTGDREEVLRRLAAGELDLDQAEALLRQR
ncbi:MAG TPA: DUF2089 domain-containing protein [Jiangellaceae bacterium]|nr:DUF2089 domain-containing protein [Jiangellaceae bacterium]